MQEAHVIDGSGHHRAPGVADSGQRCRDIDQMHYFSAQDISQRIGVVGKREFRILGDRFADEPAWQRRSHGQVRRRR
jgi:hypothetical protein